MRVRIHKGVLECDKGDGKFVPQLCLRMIGVELDSFRSAPLCNTTCPLLDTPCNGKGRKGTNTISGCEFEMLSSIPIEFDKLEDPPASVTIGSTNRMKLFDSAKPDGGLV
jgi:hypothetical protein